MTRRGREITEKGRMILTKMKGIQFNEKGLAKLQEARESGTGVFPKWFVKDMKNAEIDTEQEIIPFAKTVLPFFGRG